MGISKNIVDGCVVEVVIGWVFLWEFSFFKGRKFIQFSWNNIYLIYFWLTIVRFVKLGPILSEHKTNFEPVRALSNWSAFSSPKLWAEMCNGAKLSRCYTARACTTPWLHLDKTSLGSRRPRWDYPLFLTLKRKALFHRRSDRRFPFEAVFTM